MQMLENLIITYINTALLEPEDAGAVNADTELLLEGFVDSISVVHLVNFVSQELGYEVPPEDVTIENFGTARLLSAYLAERGVQAPAGAPAA